MLHQLGIGGPLNNLAEYTNRAITIMSGTRRTVFEQVTIKRAATILLLVCDYNDLLDMLALSCESSDGCACICAATGSDLLRLAQNAIMT